MKLSPPHEGFKQNWTTNTETLATEFYCSQSYSFSYLLIPLSICLLSIFPLKTRSPFSNSIFSYHHFLPSNTKEDGGLYGEIWCWFRGKTPLNFERKSLNFLCSFSRPTVKEMEALRGGEKTAMVLLARFLGLVNHDLLLDLWGRRRWRTGFLPRFSGISTWRRNKVGSGRYFFTLRKE